MGKPHPTRRHREGWEEQFRAMHERGHDRLIDDSPQSARTCPGELWDLKRSPNWLLDFRRKTKCGLLRESGKRWVLRSQRRN